jgi:hypothetical protein
MQPERTEAASTRELLTKHIIEMGRKGERNPKRLVDGALKIMRRSPPRRHHRVRHPIPPAAKFHSWQIN